MIDEYDEGLAAAHADMVRIVTDLADRHRREITARARRSAIIAVCAYWLGVASGMTVAAMLLR